MMKSAEREPIRVAIVNDYEVVVSGVRAMLEPFADRVRVVETEVGGTPDRSADIVLFDTFASRRTSLRRIDEIGDDDRTARLVLYTWGLSEAYLDDIDRSNIDGIVLKTQTGAQLVEALERIDAGERIGTDLLVEDPGDRDLSERELEVLALLAKGLTNRQIGHELYLSVDTVKTHVRTLFRKLEVNNRTQAALAAPRFGVDDPVRSIAG